MITDIGFHTDSAENISPDGSDAGFPDIYDSQIALQQFVPSAHSHLPFTNCLLDIFNKQFACMHEDCENNYDCFKNEYLKKDHHFQVLHLHPEDKSLFNEEILPAIQQFMEPFSNGELKQYRFSFNHRFVRKDNTTSEFLLEGTFVKPDGNDLLKMKLDVFTEIGEIKVDDTIVIIINKFILDQGYQKVFSKSCTQKPCSNLSRRELEIIRFCLEGMSSKMISDRLSISVFTVKNHKRNSMEKTATRNTAELINFCLKNNWL
jgi:DNA-binding CsgD family transcriptional regulator